MNITPAYTTCEECGKYNGIRAFGYGHAVSCSQYCADCNFDNRDRYSNGHDESCPSYDYDGAPVERWEVTEPADVYYTDAYYDNLSAFDDEYTIDEWNLECDLDRRFGEVHFKKDRSI